MKVDECESEDPVYASESFGNCVATMELMLPKSFGLNDAGSCE